MQQIIDIGLAVMEEFIPIGDGVCTQCVAEKEWERLPKGDRVHSRFLNDHELIVGDPRNTQLPSLVFQFEKTSRRVPPSANSLKLKELRQAFEDAYPTAKERSEGFVPPTPDKLDLTPRRIRRKRQEL